MRKVTRGIGFVLLIPILYIVAALVLTGITIDRENEEQAINEKIYLSTNGVHLDIIIPKENIGEPLLLGLEQDNYLSFGWGDENFYLNTPEWSDLTLSNAFEAVFLQSSTLVHVTRYGEIDPNWVEVKVSHTELGKLNAYLENTFITNENGKKIRLEGKGYTSTDDFYKAKGSYSCFKTCNSWVNTGFKESGLKACLWTPFDFGLMNKYK